MYDYLVVGAGFFGSVFAREMTNAGAKCLVIDKRGHIAGNCYTEQKNGINIHKYGPHIFHTNSEKIWNYVNKYAEFNTFSYRPKVSYRDEIYSFPINLMTLYQLWGVKTPEEAHKKLDEVRVKVEKPSNLEEWILSQVGQEIYEKFIHGYTKKQWNRDPKELPSFIIKRLPIRTTYDDNYFNDKYSGIPIGGYTQLFENLLNDIDCQTSVDYLKDRDKLNALAKKIVYTGPIDEFFDYQFGVLEWRSLRFEQEELQTVDFQGSAVINYTDYEVPYTRIIEHKHFEQSGGDNTIITKEYPQDWDKSKEKFYPVNNQVNNELYLKYEKIIDKKRYIFGGRLAKYKYYDMHQVIGSALSVAEKEIKRRTNERR